MYLQARFFMENQEEEALPDDEDGGPGDPGGTDYTVFEVNKLLRRKMARPHLSVAKYATTEARKKLFFGKPNPMLVIEDLAYHMEL